MREREKERERERERMRRCIDREIEEFIHILILLLF